MNIVPRLSALGATIAALCLPAACRAGEALTLVLAQQGAGLTVTKSSGKNYVVEAIVTVVLFGAALFVVCKSSRRV